MLAEITKSIFYFFVLATTAIVGFGNNPKAHAAEDCTPCYEISKCAAELYYVNKHGNAGPYRGQNWAFSRKCNG